MWTYRNRMRALNVSKFMLAMLLVCTVGYVAGVYITYPDLVTPCIWGTVMFYSFCAVLVRKLMS